MNKYIEYRRGNMPLIISVPHGGALVPQDIPNRDFGSYKKDKETILTLKAILADLETKNLRPYVVAMNVHRRKIDVNRGTKEGAQDAEMLKLHHRYHEYLKKSTLEVSKRFGGGLLVDLHGQNYRPGFIELGYGLSMDDINKISELPVSYIKKESTLKALIGKDNSPKDVIFGKYSLGELLDSEGYKTTPSYQYPVVDEKHFNGAYILHRHVVTKDQGIAGVNLELCFAGIRDTASNRAKFATSFTKVVVPFLKHYYGANFPWKKQS